jgi:hypothetical protein
VNNAPSATISYNGSPYCTGSGTANVTRTGSAGGTYTATPAGLSISSSTGAITLGTSSVGTYTVTYSIAASGGCSAFSTTATVAVNNAPSATIAYSGSPYCTGSGTASVTRTGSAGGTYTATPAGLSISSSTRRDHLRHEQRGHLHGYLQHRGERRLLSLQHHGHGRGEQCTQRDHRLQRVALLHRRRHGECNAHGQRRWHIHVPRQQGFRSIRVVVRSRSEAVVWALTR